MAALSPERDRCPHEAKLKGDKDTLDSCYTHDFSYDFYAINTIGKLKHLSVLHIFSKMWGYIKVKTLLQL